eukprot:5590934-Amphidinium_carterae.1
MRHQKQVAEQFGATQKTFEIEPKPKPTQKTVKVFREKAGSQHKLWHGKKQSCHPSLMSSTTIPHARCRGMVLMACQLHCFQGGAHAWHPMRFKPSPEKTRR